MNEIEKFANEVCEKRAKVVEAKKIEKAKERIVERYVRDIIDIFNISNNSEESTALIWQVTLFYPKDKNMAKFILGIDEENVYGGSFEWFKTSEILGDNSELIQKISNMQIPKYLCEDIANYFKTKLSEQFETSQEENTQNGMYIFIKIKASVKAKSE